MQMDSLVKLRKKRYETSFHTAVKDGVLSVHVGTATLEADLFAEVENEPLLRDAFVTLHPRSAGAWDDMARNAPVERCQRAQHFRGALLRNELDIGKGDFAHILAELLEEPDNPGEFRVPPYICDAIWAALVPQVVTKAKNGAETKVKNGTCQSLF